MSVEGIKILVLDRGRVKVGYVRRHPELAFHWLVEGGRIIRRWGTSDGLEQIARDGPTDQTVLDRACDTTVPYRAVIEILDAEESKWEPHLNISGERPSAARSRR